MAQSQKKPTPHTRRAIGLPGSSCGWYLADSLRQRDKALIVTPDRKVAEEVLDDLRFFIGSNAATLLPGWDTLPLEPVSPGTSTSAARVLAIDILSSDLPGIVIASADTLTQRVIPPSDIRALSTVLRRGDTIDRRALINLLLDAGFRPAKSVDEIGELSNKGAVLDLFPSTESFPVRLEFSGDTIVRMQSFDSESQRSVSFLDEVRVLPVREFSLGLSFNRPESSSERHTILDKIRQRASETGTHPREVEKILQAIEQRDDYPGLELIQFIATPDLPCLLDIVSDATPIFTIDMLLCQRAIAEEMDSANERAIRLAEEQHLIPKASDIYVDPDNLIEKLTHLTAHEVSSLAPSTSQTDTTNYRAESNIELATRLRTNIGSGSGFAPLKAFLNEWRGKK